jgi:hypothetical protein
MLPMVMLAHPQNEDRGLELWAVFVSNFIDFYENLKILRNSLQSDMANSHTISYKTIRATEDTDKAAKNTHKYWSDVKDYIHRGY